ncbi:caspase family protein [Pyxidicoccus sp. MSG2]|uniref:caspase family protein n=1 Tax=Pyxidicoccus sp. MSG2 TaxID=2996790 RepID=UPI00226FB3D8|nr:caspase family protein [Pyxidicoccus sp. MSG2]MCY1021352.1 caspase family protein [Pyxidicoccus sp. MSG2]
MSLVFDKRAERKTGGTHALIVGISSYPHLLGGRGPLARQPFNLGQLSSAARSAFDFYRWLVEEAVLPEPLVTCRLLLAPSEIELAQVPELHGHATSCGVNDFVQAASDWHQDASMSDEGKTIFFFVGHAFQFVRDDDLLLFQDFGNGIGPLFRSAVSFSNIFNGLAAGEGPMARNQLYFVDCSRNRPHGVPENVSFGATSAFDVFLEGAGHRRSAAVFHSAQPGEMAYAIPGEGTLFTSALLKGLRGGAGAPVMETDGGRTEYAVTVNSLAQWMSLESSRLSHDLNILPGFTMSGQLMRDPVIALLKQAPRVELEVEFEPPEAAPLARIRIDDAEGAPVVETPAALGPRRFHLPAGLYIVSAHFEPGAPFKGARLVTALVPPRLWRLKLKVHK